MEKTFNPRATEQKLYTQWENAGYFKPTGIGKPYCIVIPPPNVTGSLHMGHGFQYSIMDALIRYHRMRGYNALWQVGTDHAGIATQLVVEQQLLKEGIKKHDLGREQFVQRVMAWKETSRNLITAQMRRMGIAVDWQRERFTLDEGLSKAVHKVFIDLYREGLIYRGKRLANWDPVLKTAVSDLEVKFIDKEGMLWHIRYPIVDSDCALIIATTRPETMLGDAAIAVNPKDERYRQLIGKHVHLPLTDRIIPIIADDYVDMEFGTGCVKITPAHDFNDYQVGLRHNLPQINIFTPEAYLNEEVPVAYRGMERFEARKQILMDLEHAELLIKAEPYCNKVPTGDRSGAILEPYLTDQWFVRTKPLAAKAIAALKNCKPKFIPENWEKTYSQWLENIEDWCISRQLWWGHRIPAWYDSLGNIYVGENEAEVREREHFTTDFALRQDEDVLDTWFSAALWPFSSLGWPEKTKDLKTFYPTAVLVTGFDIIFFWVARMTMMGLEFTKQVPFRNVYITGLIRDSKGQKMSKSKGNVLDPIDLIDGINLEDLVKKRTNHLLLSSQVKDIEKVTREEFPDGISSSGTDALRFTFCALATQSRDINFDVKRLEGYRNFCTKLWNAARFVIMKTENADLNNVQIEYSLADKWIRGRLRLLIREINKYFNEYRFDLVAQSLYKFIWNDYCDWYLEFCKPMLQENQNAMLQNGTRRTLLEVLEITLRLIHPLMPFISEEIWQQIKPLLTGNNTRASIMQHKYPGEEETGGDAAWDSTGKDAQIELIKETILAIRNVRGELNVPPGKKLSLLLKVGTHQTEFEDEYAKLYIQTLAGIENYQFLSANEAIPPAATVTLKHLGLELFIPLEGEVLEIEKARLEKTIAKQEKDFISLKNRVDNPNFIKAPPVVVEKAKQDFIKVQSELEKLREQLAKLNN